MKVLYGVPFLSILIIIAFSLNEDISSVNQIEKYIIPFYKTVKRVSRLGILKERIRKQILAVADNYSEIYVRKKAIETAEISVYKTWARSLLVVMLCSLFALLYALTPEEDVNTLLRRKTGEGQAGYEIEAEIEGEKRNISVVLGERQYSEEEIEEWFDYGCENIEKLILGDNCSVEAVEEDLNLIEQLPDSSIAISWQCSDYSIVQPNGELIRENISKEGEKIKLVAVFSYMDSERKHEINLLVKRKSYTGIEKYFEELKETIAIEEKAERIQKTYSLPTKIEGKDIKYSTKEGYEELLIFVFGLVIAILLPLREKASVNKEKQKRNHKMLLEYPELVCKLSLYLGAGMNISKAWEKIALDSTDNLNNKEEISLLNEQVLYTYRQLQSGSLIVKSFEDFGNRCGLQDVKKLSLLINSNLKKGSADLALILEKEAKEALEKRKSLIISKATEASIKLMLPMMMELVVVIGILVVPAFLTLEV